jgi:hypothetical protein
MSFSNDTLMVFTVDPDTLLIVFGKAVTYPSTKKIMFDKENQVVYVTNGTAVRQVSLSITRNPMTSAVTAIDLDDTTFILKNYPHTAFRIAG